MAPFEKLQMEYQMTSLNVSFEFFPPKTIEGSFRLWDTVQTLAPLAPRFVSVTYGAGGTTRQLTREAVAAIAHSTDLCVAAHLTCVDATKEDTLSLAKSWADLGIKDIVALRGDPPKGTERFAPHPEGFANSCEMIEALAASGDFNIRVGAYPHKHPEAASLKDDVDWLKRKIDAGASEAITQFFFEADDFFRFRDLCVKSGITAPITPGILPIENWAGTKAFAQRCGAQIPNWMDAAFQTALRDDRSDLLSVALSTELCSDLIDGGVENFHFYTLNKPLLTRDICAAIGVTPQTVLQKVA